MGTIKRRPSVTPAQLVDGVLAADERATARLMRLIDDRPEAAREALSALYPHTGRAHVIGITGNPGSGKSTLVSQLIGHYRAQDARVGVVAVDPSSPFSGGAILGDRVRMMSHAADPGVFIRSAASRGALGGLSHSTEDLVVVLDAFGRDVILVETVGVGQSEVEIVQLAQTTAVVLTPGYGDDVQALKAGLLEIADLFVVNKADLDGTNALVRQLRALWQLTPDRESRAWRPPIVATVARDGTGIDSLATKLAEHAAHIAEHISGRDRERARLRRILMRRVEQDLMRHITRTYLAGDALDDVLDELVGRTRDPYSVAAEIVRAALKDDAD